MKRYRIFGLFVLFCLAFSLSLAIAAGSDPPLAPRCCVEYIPELDCYKWGAYVWKPGIGTVCSCSAAEYADECMLKCCNDI